MKKSEQKCARTRAFWRKMHFFSIFAILNLLQGAFKHVIPKQFCTKKPPIPRACASYKRFEILNFFNFGIIQNNSSMRYIKLQVNLDEEFISVIKTDIGVF